MQPNILLVTVDCLRRDHVGCYGYDRPTTPNIDALAAEGGRSDCIANAPGTRWAFKPLYMAAHALQVENAGLPPKAGTTVVEALPDAYTTGCFAHNQFVSRLTHLDRGYDVFVGPEDHPADDRADRITVDRATAWLADAPEPWFCHVHLMDAHAPWERRDGLLEAIRGDTNVPHVERAHDHVTPGRAPPQKVIDAYDVGIRSADEQIGRLIDASTADSAVIVTADHGEEFGTYHDYHWAHLGPTMTDVPLVTRGIETGAFPQRHLHVPHLILEAAGGGDSPRGWLHPAPHRPAFCSLEEQVGAVVHNARYIRDVETGNEFYLGNCARGSAQSSRLREHTDEMVAYCEANKIGEGIDTSDPELDDAAKERLKDLGYLN